MSKGLAAISRGLAALEVAGLDEPLLEMKLRAAKSWAVAFGRHLPSETVDDCNRCLVLAERVGNPEYALRAHWRLAPHELYAGRSNEALAHLARYRETALREGDTSWLPDAKRLTASAEMHRRPANTVPPGRMIVYPGASNFSYRRASRPCVASR